MTFMQILFIFTALITLGSAVMVVSAKRMMHAAFSLVLTLVGIAILFALLESRFFTVVQVVVYVGAISTLLIFSIMLTRWTIFENVSQRTENWKLATLALGFLFLALFIVMVSWPGFSIYDRAIQEGGEDLVQLGKGFVDPMGFLIPFEVASVLLLAAMLGGVLMASKKKVGGT